MRFWIWEKSIFLDSQNFELPKENMFILIKFKGAVISHQTQCKEIPELKSRY
jgi:hypothetical protein